MQSKVKFICFDGPDNAGKSTLINELLGIHPELKLFQFKKILPNGDLLRINSMKDFELIFGCWEHLDPRYVYVLDRFVISNLVYDKVLRDEDVSLSTMYKAEFESRFDVLTMILTRPKIDIDFVDDKISIPMEIFNAIIDEYKKHGTNYEMLDYKKVESGRTVIELQKDVHNEILKTVKAFISK